MAKPSGRRPRQRRSRFEVPDADHRVLIEDVDGVTVVVRTHTPLTDADRELLREYVEKLQLGATGEAELTLPPSLQGVPMTEALDEATVWLSRDEAAQRQQNTKALDRCHCDEYALLAEQLHRISIDDDGAAWMHTRSSCAIVKNT